MNAVAKAVLALSLSVLSTAALAEEAKPATKPIPTTFDWSACKPNAEKFCKGVEGNENIYACLLKHDDDLSKACDAVHSSYEVATGRK
jgi:hypothetical protein